MSGVEKFERYLRASEEVAISGSGELRAGEALVRISGSGRYVEGELLKLAGSARVKGDLEVKTVAASGSLRVEGSLKASDFRSSGSVIVERDLEAGSLSASGSLRVGGELRARSARISGSLGAESVRAEYLEADGALEIRDLLKVSKAVLRPCGNSSIGRIEADSLEVRRAKPIRGELSLRLGPIEVDIALRGGVAFRSGRKGVLKVKSIDTLRAILEGVECEELRAEVAVLKRGCRIGRAVYSERLEVEEGVEIGEVVKVEDPFNRGREPS